ncbi:MAG: ABC transporter permease [Dehalococcoidia bacterium]
MATRSATAGELIGPERYAETGRRALRGATRFARQNPLGAVGALVIIGLVLAAVFAPLITPTGPTLTAPLDRLQSPRAAHWFGTDDIGRDIYTRVVFGARISLEVGIATVVLGTVFGAAIGLFSGYFAGTADMVIQRLLDSVQSVPGLLLALVVAAVIGKGTINTVFPIALVIMPVNARVVRSAVLSVRESLFVEGARVIGAGDGRIMLRHILPNVTAPILILASIWIGNAIIIEASLSFLGLGTTPPTPSWGNMLAGQGRAYMEQAPWLAIFPGLAITLTVLSFNLLGDALRDTWDPKLRGRV